MTEESTPPESATTTRSPLCGPWGGSGVTSLAVLKHLPFELDPDGVDSHRKTAVSLQYWRLGALEATLNKGLSGEAVIAFVLDSLGCILAIIFASRSLNATICLNSSTSCESRSCGLY